MGMIVCLHVCMYAMSVSCPQKSEEGISAPGTGVTYMVVSFCVDTGNQTQVKVLLTTEPPLQPVYYSLHIL